MSINEDSLIDHVHLIRNEDCIIQISRFGSNEGSLEDFEVFVYTGYALGLVCLNEIGLGSGLRSSFLKNYFVGILESHFVMKGFGNFGYGY